MLRYAAAAAALKTLSVSSSFYRLLGNTVGARGRVKVGLRQQYLDRAKKVFAISKRYKIEDGQRLLELGTGWVHWESLIFRLFNDVEIVLLDVWDNRQLAALKQYCRQLDAVIDVHIDMNHAQSVRAHGLLDQILTVNSFDEMYRLLNWKYVIEPSGKLQNLPADHFDLAYSVNVAEHIHSHLVPGYVKDMYRILKPGGLSIHTIDLTDHLTTQYAPDMSVKNYLRYSDRVWKMFFENGPQYFNRLQRSQWLAYFDGACFELKEDFSRFDNIGPIKVHKQYGNLTQKDVDCMALNIVHKKPYAES